MEFNLSRKLHSAVLTLKHHAVATAPNLVGLAGPLAPFALGGALQSVLERNNGLKPSENFTIGAMETNNPSKILCFAALPVAALLVPDMLPALVGLMDLSGIGTHLDLAAPVNASHDMSNAVTIPTHNPDAQNTSAPTKPFDALETLNNAFSDFKNWLHGPASPENSTLEYVNNNTIKNSYIKNCNLNGAYVDNSTLIDVYARGNVSFVNDTITTTNQFGAMIVGFDTLPGVVVNNTTFIGGADDRFFVDGSGLRIDNFSVDTTGNAAKVMIITSNDVVENLHDVRYYNHSASDPFAVPTADPHVDITVNPHTRATDSHSNAPFDLGRFVSDVVHDFKVAAGLDHASPKPPDTTKPGMHDQPTPPPKHPTSAPVSRPTSAPVQVSATAFAVA